MVVFVSDPDNVGFVSVKVSSGCCAIQTPATGVVTVDIRRLRYALSHYMDVNRGCAIVYSGDTVTVYPMLPDQTITGKGEDVPVSTIKCGEQSAFDTKYTLFNTTPSLSVRRIPALEWSRSLKTQLVIAGVNGQSTAIELRSNPDSVMLSSLNESGTTIRYEVVLSGSTQDPFVVSNMGARYTRMSIASGYALCIQLMATVKNVSVDGAVSNMATRFEISCPHSSTMATVFCNTVSTESSTG
jgi:hypothetical protein